MESQKSIKNGIGIFRLSLINFSLVIKAYIVMIKLNQLVILSKDVIFKWVHKGSKKITLTRWALSLMTSMVS